MRKTHNEKRGISRTMEWLKIPTKKQREFSENFLSIDVDYLQYTCYKISEPLKNLYNILGFSGTIDTDNSNIEYNYSMNLSLTHNDTKMGHAYMISFMSVGFPAIPIGSVELYNPNRVKTLGTEGKIVLYGAYFRFLDIIKEEAPEVVRFANSLELGTVVNTQKNLKPVYKRTRVDIAIDVTVPVDQKWMTKYICPHKNSKQVVKPYNYKYEEGLNHSKGFQSFGYIPRLGQCMGLRVYNKILDIQNKKKTAWYPEYLSLNKPITRIELIFGGDFATGLLDNLLEYAQYRILGNIDEVRLKRKIRPRSEYSPLSAYKYFTRYAKNHGKTLKDVIDDVFYIWKKDEERKESIRQEGLKYGFSCTF